MCNEDVAHNLEETLKLIKFSDRESLSLDKRERRKIRTYSTQQVQILLDKQIRNCSHKYLLESEHPNKKDLNLIKATKRVI